MLAPALLLSRWVLRPVLRQHTLSASVEEGAKKDPIGPGRPVDSVSCPGLLKSAQLRIAYTRYYGQ